MPRRKANLPPLTREWLEKLRNQNSRQTLLEELAKRNMEDLYTLARVYDIKYYTRKRKNKLIDELIDRILAIPPVNPEVLEEDGDQRDAGDTSSAFPEEMSGQKDSPEPLQEWVDKLAKLSIDRLALLVRKVLGEAGPIQIRDPRESALQIVRAAGSPEVLEALYRSVTTSSSGSGSSSSSSEGVRHRRLRMPLGLASSSLLEDSASASTSAPPPPSGVPSSRREEGQDGQTISRVPAVSHPISARTLEELMQRLDNRIYAEGVLKVLQEGFGILRSSDFNYLSSPDDIFVPPNIIKRYGLKTGDTIGCTIRLPRPGERMYTVGNLVHINGLNPEEVRQRTPFEYLKALFPDEPFHLVTGPTDYSMRIVELFAPIGKGQRGLIVAQPKTGKTTLLKGIAKGIMKNHPDVYVIVLLINERPEEVTDWERDVGAEIIASTFDNPAEKHVEIAELVLEKAKRLVECRHDVVILLDSLTRLARAYNDLAPASGKVLSGGVESSALNPPKQFFGSARNIEGRGSLTIIATALIDTGSRMDEVIFEEFKGTGNMEIKLNRRMAERRIFPAIDLLASGTRREELLMDEWTLKRMWVLRQYLSKMPPEDALLFILKQMEGTADNREFLMAMNQG